MTYVLTCAQMRAADAAAVAEFGADALMRHAGERIATVLRQRLAPGDRVIAFAGPGNNGGDAFAALAELDATYERIVYATDSISNAGIHATAPVAQARAAAIARAVDSGVVVREFPETRDCAQAALTGTGFALDGLFGTGARLPIPPRYHAVVEALNAKACSVLAIDIPSGIDADTGAIIEPAVRASLTISLAAAKPGTLLDPARECVGELLVADIGISGATLAQHAHTFAALDNCAFLALLPQRPAIADKRSAGAPLIIAGSTQFPGAAVLCARAAARAGAGYVTLATPASAAAAIRAHLIEQVVVELSPDAPARDVVEELLDIAKHNSAIAIGPGLGLDDRTGDIVRGVIARSALPIVADAAALFHLAKHLDGARGKRIVITPHAGEFARLSGLGSVAEGERVPRLREFVERTGIVTLLKGRSTLIFDGTTTHINTTGTSALATAGTGDVLTGIIATLLSQGLSPVDAARVGAYWHGLAGQLCATQRRVGVGASDIPEALAIALPTQRTDGGITRLF